MGTSSLRGLEGGRGRILTALVLLGSAGSAAAQDPCANIPPPPPPKAVATCSRAIAEFDTRAPVPQVAIARDSPLLNELSPFGVQGIKQGLGGASNVWVLNVKPEVSRSSEATLNLCTALKKVKGMGVLTGFERSAYVTLRGVHPSDPLYSYQQPMLDEVHAVQAWERISKILPTPVPVAVVDSGIHYIHPDLVDSMWTDPASKAHGMSFVKPGRPDDIDDVAGHGTNVAGVLAATTDNNIGVSSIAWRGHIEMAIARFTKDDTGCVDDMINGIHYAAYDVGAHIINLSAGTSDRSVQLLKQLQAIGRDKKQTLIVAAVDNTRQNLDDPTIPAYDYPATFRLPNVIAVQASGIPHDFQPSSYGRISVHIAAPSIVLQTTAISGDLYASATGTSISAPQVSAAAALISDFAPKWSYSQIKQYLIDSARDPGCAPPTGSTAWDSLCGKSQSEGVLNVDAATGAPMQFAWPAHQSPWRLGMTHEVSWSVLFATDQCREVQFLYSTDGGAQWTPIASPSTARVSALHHEVTLPDSIPPGTVTRLAARCTDTRRLERWSQRFVVE